MKSGKLIVIEGVDGSGKETQSKKLAEHLTDDGYAVLSIAFPRYHKDSSAMVKHYLAGDFGKRPEEVSPYTASTFYAADRYAAYKEEMAAHLDKGGIVIADRYTTANMVHQAGKIRDGEERQCFLDWLTDYEFRILGLPKPDLVFFLDIPPEVSARLIADRDNKMTGEKQKDIHEADPFHLSAAYCNAVQLAEQYRWQRIHCVKDGGLRSIEDIHEEILSLVKEQLDV